VLTDEPHPDFVREASFKTIQAVTAISVIFQRDNRKLSLGSHPGDKKYSTIITMNGGSAAAREPVLQTVSIEQRLTRAAIIAVTEDGKWACYIET
jgi:hypothetical protein